MASIGEATQAFIFIFAGIFNLIPYILSATLFILNDLPQSRLSTSLYSFLTIFGLATASLTGIGNAMLLVAGAETATSSSIFISLMTFAFLRVVCQSVVALAVERKMLRLPLRAWSVLVPVITTRTFIWTAASLVCHLVEGILVALIPSQTSLLDYKVLWLYIPGFVAHAFLCITVAFHVAHPTSSP